MSSPVQPPVHRPAPALPLHLRLELLRQRGAAERLAIQLVQLHWRERLGTLRHGAGLLWSLLRLFVRGPGIAGAALSGGRGWMRIAAWIAPWVLIAVRRYAARKPANAAAPEPPVDSSATLRDLQRRLRRMARARDPQAGATAPGAPHR